MIKKLKKTVLQMIAGANIATILLMLLSGFSDRIDPQDYMYAGVAGLFFPFLLVANVVFLAFWIIVKTRWAWIPLGGLIAGFLPVRNYLPINGSASHDEATLKVVSYNVWAFQAWEDKTAPNPIYEYLAKEDADIVCLQEMPHGKNGSQQILSATGGKYQYCDTINKQGKCEVLCVLSKYPILKKEHVGENTENEHSAAFRLLVGEDTIVVVNTHLATSKLSVDERNKFRVMIDGKMERDSAKAESKAVVQKLALASVNRAPQVKDLARYIEEQHLPVILCGDFNDSPVSYAHHRIGQLLEDCFVSSGNGPGFTYHHHGMRVRIDHIFCSDIWEPQGCYADNKISASDHYPVITWLKKRSKP